MTENPFAGMDLKIPTKYSEEVKKYCAKSNTKAGPKMAPFDRQVDFWFTAFVLAAHKGLERTSAEDTTKIIEGSILSNEPHRITVIQLVHFSMNKSLEDLANHREVFNFAGEMANSGIPVLLQILKDDEDLPLFNLFDELESLAS